VQRYIIIEVAMTIAAIVIVGGRGQLPPAQLGFEIVVVNETDDYGTLTYELKAPEYAQALTFDPRFSPQSSQPTGGEVVHSR